MSPPELSPPLAALEARLPSRATELRDIARCVGCMLARSEETGEEILVSTPAIAACTGRPRVGPEVNTLYNEIRRFERNGLLEVINRKEVPAFPRRGAWQPGRTFFFRITALGQQAIPAQPQDTCGLRDPFVHITPVEQRVLDCARCILARTADSDSTLAGSFLTEQITGCLDKAPQSVNRILRSFRTDGLLERETVLWHAANTGPKPFRYWPSDRAAPWISPKKAEDCSQADITVPPKELTASQERILQCMTCVSGGCDSDVFRRADILACTKINTHVIGGFLTDLVGEGYLERRASGEVGITDIGSRFLADREPPDNCPSGRQQQWLDLRDYASLKRNRTFGDILRCIGCMTARQEPISSGTIAACNGRESSGTGLMGINAPIKWLMANGLVEPYTPDKIPETPPWGDWRLYQANFMRLTAAGFLALSIRAQKDCNLQNPLVRLTPDQKKIVDCFRCVLGRSADMDIPTTGGVIGQQIADCLGVRPAKPVRLLKALCDQRLLDRKITPNLFPGQGRGPDLYWPTSEGERWLSPRKGNDCWDVPLI